MKTTQNVSKDNLDNLRNKILKCSKSFYDQIYSYKTISIRQFVLSNFVLSDRQIEDHKVIWTKVGGAPPRKFWKN